MKEKAREGKKKGWRCGGREEVTGKEMKEGRK